VAAGADAARDGEGNAVADALEVVESASFIVSPSDVEVDVDVRGRGEERGKGGEEGEGERELSTGSRCSSAEDDATPNPRRGGLRTREPATNASKSKRTTSLPITA
jgi:hypothetical protein